MDIKQDTQKVDDNQKVYWFKMTGRSRYAIPTSWQGWLVVVGMGIFLYWDLSSSVTDQATTSDKIRAFVFLVLAVIVLAVALRKKVKPLELKWKRDGIDSGWY